MKDRAVAVLRLVEQLKRGRSVSRSDWSVYGAEIITALGPEFIPYPHITGGRWSVLDTKNPRESR